MTHLSSSRPAMVPEDLGELLVSLGLVAQRQLEAVRRQLPPGGELSAGLLAANMIGQRELEDVQTFHERWLHATSLSDRPVTAQLLASLHPGFAMRHRVLPVGMIAGRLLVAFPRSIASTLGETRLLDEVSLVAGKSTLGWPVDDEDLQRACTFYYDPHTAHAAINRALDNGQATELTSEDGEKTPSDAPIIDLVNDLLSRAIEANASDLHLNPLPDGLLARMRVDGVLQDLMMVPKPLKSHVINRLKLMAQLNITDHRHPQDGRISFVHGDRTFDVRVAVVPTRWGELVVLRILRPLAKLSGLQSLGFQPGDLDRYQRIAGAPHGIILVTGPTGSGKSSTLYTTLDQFDRVENHVITIEDPIEFTIDRAMQIQVNHKIGLDFATALRSVLRLDPNIIMVGEIRDHETLQIAIDAAMTGHLVLSTLHTNDAASSIARMEEMGAKRHRLATALVGIIAQRLVRRLCLACREPVQATPAERLRLGRPEDEPLTLYRPVGCPACSGVGYKGRLGLFEVLELDEALGQAIIDGASTIALQRLAVARGMTTLSQDGRAKVLAGATTLKEVERTVREPQAPSP